jgi:hypothetical protein
LFWPGQLYVMNDEDGDCDNVSRRDCIDLLLPHLCNYIVVFLVILIKFDDFSPVGLIYLSKFQKTTASLSKLLLNYRF